MHNPIDRDAYQTLQQITANKGYLDDDSVMDWMAAELTAIASLGGVFSPGQSAFISRKV